MIVLIVLRTHGRMATYVASNWVSFHVQKKTSTRRVLSAMKRLEAAGLVKRAPTSYRVMLSWEALADAPAPGQAKAPSGG